MSNDKLLQNKILIGRLLRLAGRNFSNHENNDFDLASIIPDRVDRQKLMQTIFDEDDPDRYDPTNDYSIVRNDELMLYFADKLLE